MRDIIKDIFNSHITEPSYTAVFLSNLFALFAFVCSVIRIPPEREVERKLNQILFTASFFPTSLIIILMAEEFQTVCQKQLWELYFISFDKNFQDAFL